MKELEKEILENEIKELQKQIREKQKLLKENEEIKYGYIVCDNPTFSEEKIEIIYVTDNLVRVKIGSKRITYKRTEVALSLKEYYEKSIEKLLSNIKYHNERVSHYTCKLNMFKDKLSKLAYTIELTKGDSK
jgi:pyruvate-formate lyase